MEGKQTQTQVEYTGDITKCGDCRYFKASLLPAVIQYLLKESDQTDMSLTLAKDLCGDYQAAYLLQLAYNIGTLSLDDMVIQGDCPYFEEKSTIF